MDVVFKMGAVSWGQLPTSGLPEVAFVGRSNVGKSSLLNMLAGQKKLARFSSTPGKTQQFNYYLVDEKWYLVDLPGYGYAKVAQTRRAYWQSFIGQFTQNREPLKLVFHLLDARHEPTRMDQELMMLMRESPASYVAVLTKSDKLSGNQRGKSIARAKKTLASYGREAPIILSSASKNRGRKEMVQWIRDILNIPVK